MSQYVILRYSEGSGSDEPRCFGVPQHDSSEKPRRRIPRAIWKILRIAALVYIGLIIVLATAQTWFIFPGAATQGRRDAIVRPSEGAEPVKLKAKTGDDVAALFGYAMTPDGQPHPSRATRPTLVYFYGNGMCMADCIGDFRKLRRRGFNIIVPDYLGYGMSGGKPGEAGVYATADACFDYLESRGDIDKARIVPMGWSLGAAAATHLAATRNTPALVLMSAFTSIDDMARRLFPYLPTGMILRHHLDSESNIRQVRCPIFLGHGTRDSIIPFAMSNDLAEAAGGPVTKYDVIDGDHNDVFDVGGTALADAIASFVEQNAGQ